MLYYNIYANSSLCFKLYLRYTGNKSISKSIRMKSIEIWLSEYGQSHTHPTNKFIHWVAVPVIYLTVIGFMWDIPRPEVFIGPWLNWATLIAVPILIFYFMQSLVVGVAMTGFTLTCILLVAWFDQLTVMPVSLLSLILFVIMWILQFYGQLGRAHV